MKRIRAALMVTAIVAGLAAMAAGQQPTYTVVDLSPAGSVDSSAIGVGGGQQVGTASFGSFSHPWSGPDRRAALSI